MMLLVSSRKERKVQVNPSPQGPGNGEPPQEQMCHLWSSHSGAFSLMVYAMLMERKMDFEEEPSLLVELLGKTTMEYQIISKGDVEQRLKINQYVRYL